MLGTSTSSIFSTVVCRFSEGQIATKQWKLDGEVLHLNLNSTKHLMGGNPRLDFNRNYFCNFLGLEYFLDKSIIIIGAYLPLYVH